MIILTMAGKYSDDFDNQLMLNPVHVVWIRTDDSPVNPGGAVIMTVAGKVAVVETAYDVMKLFR